MTEDENASGGHHDKGSPSNSRTTIAVPSHTMSSPDNTTPAERRAQTSTASNRSISSNRVSSTMDQLPPLPPKITAMHGFTGLLPELQKTVTEQFDSPLLSDWVYLAMVFWPKGHHWIISNMILKSEAALLSNDDFLREIFKTTPFNGEFRTPNVLKPAHDNPNDYTYERLQADARRRRDYPKEWDWRREYVQALITHRRGCMLHTKGHRTGTEKPDEEARKALKIKRATPESSLLYKDLITQARESGAHATALALKNERTRQEKRSTRRKDKLKAIFDVLMRMMIEPDYLLDVCHGCGVDDHTGNNFVLSAIKHHCHTCEVTYAEQNMIHVGSLIALGISVAMPWQVKHESWLKVVTIKAGVNSCRAFVPRTHADRLCQLYYGLDLVTLRHLMDHGHFDFHKAQKLAWSYGSAAKVAHAFLEQYRQGRTSFDSTELVGPMSGPPPRDEVFVKVDHEMVLGVLEHTDLERSDSDIIWAQLVHLVKHHLMSEMGDTHPSRNWLLNATTRLWNAVLSLRMSRCTLKEASDIYHVVRIQDFHHRFGTHDVQLDNFSSTVGERESLSTRMHSVRLQNARSLDPAKAQLNLTLYLGVSAALCNLFRRFHPHIVELMVDLVALGVSADSEEELDLSTREKRFSVFFVYARIYFLTAQAMRINRTYLASTEVPWSTADTMANAFDLSLAEKDGVLHKRLWQGLLQFSAGKNLVFLLSDEAETSLNSRKTIPGLLAGLTTRKGCFILRENAPRAIGAVVCGRVMLEAANGDAAEVDVEMEDVEGV